MSYYSFESSFSKIWSEPDSISFFRVSNLWSEAFDGARPNLTLFLVSGLYFYTCVFIGAKSGIDLMRKPNSVFWTGSIWVFCMICYFGRGHGCSIFWSNSCFPTIRVRSKSSKSEFIFLRSLTTSMDLLKEWRLYSEVIYEFKVKFDSYLNLLPKMRSIISGELATAELFYFSSVLWPICSFCGSPNMLTFKVSWVTFVVSKFAWEDFWFGSSLFEEICCFLSFILLILLSLLLTILIGVSASTCVFDRTWFFFTPFARSYGNLGNIICATWFLMYFMSSESFLSFDFDFFFFYNGSFEVSMFEWCLEDKVMFLLCLTCLFSDSYFYTFLNLYYKGSYFGIFRFCTFIFLKGSPFVYFSSSLEPKVLEIVKSF